MKNKSYLFERKYTISGKKKIPTKEYEYWNSILGKELLSEILKKNENIELFLQNEQFCFEDNICEFKKITKQGDRKIVDKYEDVWFWEFYEYFLNNASLVFYDFIISKQELVSISILQSFSKNLLERLQKICLRTLIYEMNFLKNRKMLTGKNQYEEYDFFCKKVIGTKEFRNLLFEEFPVLERCIDEMISDTIEFYKIVITHFEKDNKKIAEVLLKKRVCGKIKQISCGQGDVHQNGKQVVKIVLTDEDEVIYKPRAMSNEIIYYDLLKKLDTEIGIQQYYYPILSYDDHSWCQVVVAESCKSENELKLYYNRLGIQLFAAYMLGIRDLHSENIIAFGQYPVIIDLEMLIYMKQEIKCKTAKDSIKKNVLSSVLMTSMLPFYMWNKDGKGINISAFNGESGQTYPFRVPKVINERTSNMSITYAYPISTTNSNLAQINDKFVDPLFYENEIVEGFKKAYTCVLENKIILKRVKQDIGRIKNRVLVADTQKYTMLLSASYHPSLMSDGAKREIFLYSLWHKRKEKDRDIVEKEIRSLLRGDIPYFYVKGDSTSICSDGMKIGKEYYQDSPTKILESNVDTLNEVDMEKQIEYIKLSLRMSEAGRHKCLNNTYCIEKIKSWPQKGELIKMPYEQLLSMILKNAIWNDEHTEVNWEIMNFSAENKRTWDIKPMNKYLYNGQSGMLVLFYHLNKYKKCKEIKDIFENLKKQIFEYTENNLHSLENLDSNYTGLYEGEASILYTYILLYEWSSEKEYLKQAENHANIVMQLLNEDKKYDLTYGNAGAAKALIQLYRITRNKKYLDVAEDAIDILMKNAKIMEKGIGWKVINDIEPMSGMAHGNSGILLPVVSLWNVTKNMKYKKMVDQIIEYEDYLYDGKTGDWKDSGNISEEIENSVAWCHGAAGILLSRITYYSECKDMLEESDRAILKNDIEQAYKKLSHYWLRNSYSLCHGICGNILILELADKILNKKNKKHELVEEMKRKIQEEIYLLPQEKLNPGLLSGYGGILYWILQQDEVFEFGII